jgi:hypothetical protein
MKYPLPSNPSANHNQGLPYYAAILTIDQQATNTIKGMLLKERTLLIKWRHVSYLRL